MNSFLEKHVMDSVYWLSCFMEHLVYHDCFYRNIGRFSVLASRHFSSRKLTGIWGETVQLPDGTFRLTSVINKFSVRHVTKHVIRTPHKCHIYLSY